MKCLLFIKVTKMKFIGLFKYLGAGSPRSLARAASVVAMLGSAAAHAQTYTYFSTINDARLTFPGSTSIDVQRGRLFIGDGQADIVAVYDTATLAPVATIGSGAGSDNSHFASPVAPAIDVAHSRLFIPDVGNDRVQVFDAQTYAYQGTIGVSGVAGSDNSHLFFPRAVAVNSATAAVYITDTNNNRVQVYDANLNYVATIGVSGVAGSDNSHLNAPVGIAYNTATNQIFVGDRGNGRIQIYDAGSLNYVATIGQTAPGGTSFDNAHLVPQGVAIDPVAGLVLGSDDTNYRIQGFNVLTNQYVTTLGTTASPGSSNSQFALPGTAAADPTHNLLFVPDATNKRVQIFTITPSPLHSAVLPGGRSVQVGTRSTIFATIINAGSTTLSNCQISLPTSAPAGLTMDYQITDPTTNALTGTINSPVSIAAGVSQSFVLGFQSTAAFTESAMPVNYSCDGATPASLVAGVNTVDLTFSSSPIADVIALSLTPSGDGVARMSVGSTGFFALASINIGVPAQLTVAPDFGGAFLPLTATICATNPTTGACLAAPASSVTFTDATNATPTFTVFLTPTSSVAFAPATNRVFVRFVDGAGLSHGETNVAVATN
ncbi:MAG TPA: NHL repeat-containing protein [Rhizomicrobium sp.]|nr:NHL repeat-containing protein [Rhizomicrobium sp.]